MGRPPVVVSCVSLVTGDVEHLSELTEHLRIFLVTQGARDGPGIQWLSEFLVRPSKHTGPGSSRCNLPHLTKCCAFGTRRLCSTWREVLSFAPRHSPDTQRSGRLSGFTLTFLFAFLKNN